MTRSSASGATELARDLARELRVLEPVTEPAPVRVGRVLSREWGCDMLAYRPCVASDGTWTLAFLEGTGFAGRPDTQAELRRFVAHMPADWGWGSPLRVAAPWQNRTVRAREEPAYFSPDKSPLADVRELYARFPLASRDHLRVNVCDGPLMLAYLGVWRDEPFGTEEQRAFEAIVPAVRARLRIDRLLEGAPADLEALAAALDKIAAPAFMLHSDGRIELANEAGAALLAERRGLLADDLRRAATETPPPGIEITHTGGFPGVAARCLAVVRPARREPLTREAAATHAWQLSARQAAVLARVVRGDSNKEIASHLAVSEVTIESHVTAILRKAKVDSRARVIAAYWTLEA